MADEVQEKRKEEEIKISLGSQDRKQATQEAVQVRGKKRKMTKEERKSTEATKKEKKMKVTARKKPGFDKELYEETTYFVKNGLRHVQPYYFTFTTHCKGRWVGRKLFDVFKDEFRLESPEYYEKAIRSGKITVNGGNVTADTILKDNEILRNRVHRHEPPVTDQPLQMIECNEEVVVLNKPCSIPVHPCGRYRHNTMVFLLGKEHNLRNLYTVHRIDRLTSGILIFARTLKKAQELEAQVRDREIQKEYICRVCGEFPSEPVDCQQPILVVSHKIGVCRVNPDGKPCRTIFTKLHSDGKTSVVKCVPYTGRMHQIRVHLQWLGYPIINDPIYNHPAWGPDRGKGGVTDNLAFEVITALAKSTTIIDSDTSSSTGDRMIIPATLPCETSTSVDSSSRSNTCSTTMKPLKLVSPVKGVQNQGTGDETLIFAHQSVSRNDDSTKCLDSGESQIVSRSSSFSTPLEQSAQNKNDCVQSFLRENSDKTSKNHSNESNTNKTDVQEITAQELRFVSDLPENRSGEKSCVRDGNCYEDLKAFWDEDCSECRIHRRNPTPAELTMCLHALSYKGPDWEYQTPVPPWAAEDWQE